MANVIMIEVDKNNADNACSDMVSAIEKHAKNNLPDITIENDGIGAYEYWGARGVDRGKNYALVENKGPYTFGVDITGHDADYIDAVTSDSFEGETVAFHNETFGDINVELKFVVRNFRIENGVFLLSGEWEE